MANEGKWLLVGSIEPGACTWEHPVTGELMFPYSRLTPLVFDAPLRRGFTRRFFLRTIPAVAVAILMVATRAEAQRQSGIQRTPDGQRVLVSKDVGGQRYAITLNTADGSVTGNVFSTDGSPPKFISCVQTGLRAFSCRVADTCDAGGTRQSGIQQVFAGTAILVSKDVAGDRFAITQNVDGTLTGNVFSAETGASTFLFCTPDNAGGFSCAASGTCTTLPCTGQFTTIGGSITLPDTFFTLPATCATYGPPIQIVLPNNFFIPDPEVMSAAARQVIVNNPYRTTQVGKTGLVNDLVIANRVPNGPAIVGDTAQCPGGGQQRLVSCEVVQTDSGPATSFSIAFEGCRSAGDATGFIQQTGNVGIFLPGATICLLLTPAEIPFGIELGEGRQNFETIFFSAPAGGAISGIDLENTTSSMTYLDVCVGADKAFTPSVRQFASISSRSMIDLVPGSGQFLTVDKEFDFVTIRRELSPDCAVRTTTLFSGSSGDIATVDQRFGGESYATRFTDLRLALDDSNQLSIDGGLVDVCLETFGTRADRSFAYRTLTPARFVRDTDGCPRGGSFEVSADGAVVGQVSFGDAGGVTLTPLSGPPITFATCDDPLLILKTCPFNGSM